MKRFLFLTLGYCLLTINSTAQTRQLFDDNWQFLRNGMTMQVNLPHDWDIYDAPDPKTGATKEGGGWYQGGKGEYRKIFATPDADIVKLHFEGVYQKAEVFVNGQKAGQHAYGYTPFTVDVTPFLKGKNDNNEVVVKVNNSEQPNCRWYSGSGIYRHVWLETMPTLHFADNGVRIWTADANAKNARVDMNVWVENNGGNTQQIDDVDVSFVGGSFTLRHDNAPHLYSPYVIVANQPKRDFKGMTMVNVDTNKSERRKIENTPLPNGKVATFVMSYNIDNPHLWSPDDPYLYEAVVKLKSNGKVIDERHVKFGIRTFSYDAENGLVLNGKKVLINGACVHHDDGVLGAMAFNAAEIRKVKLMKEAGFNLIRTSHNPTTRAFLDACDSLGMLVIGEAFDGWRTQKNPYDYSTLIDSCYREDIHAMVERDMNHPSIISWSIGNEVIERKDIRVVTTARKLKAAIKEIDDTRPVTEALCAWDSDWEIYDPHFEVLDIGGYNYMIHKHAEDHQRDPKRVMWQTESFPRDAFSNWKLVHDYPYIIGDIVWTGLDYLGESGIGRNYYDGERPGEHWVDGGQPEWHGAYCGDVDITGWRKPISHYREMLWNSEERILYLAVKEPDGYRGKINTTSWSVWPTWESWNWPGWEGKPIEVEVYTKQPEVKLYLNDQLVGTKQVSRDTEYKAVFTVNYEPGTLRAEVSTPLPHREGAGVSLFTSGSPARLRLTPDKTVMTADGQDLTYITLEVVDKQGRVCPDAAIPCEAIVKGQGSLLSFASADLKDTEPYTSSRVTTWKGRALLVVRSSHTKGKAQVSIKSSLPTANITIKTK